MTLAVVSFYWEDPERAKVRRTSITPEDVRLWDRMVARHLSVPHKRICITHRPDLIDFMATVPLDWAKHVPGTCTVKLMARRPDFGEVVGATRILLMDVDCVVTGSLDPIVQREEEAVFWRNPNYERGGWRGFYQGSLQLFTAGAHPELWTDFDPASTLDSLSPRFGGAEQRWISERLNTVYPQAGWEWKHPCWTEADGVYGAGRLVGWKMGKGVQSVLPDNARVVFFPGDRSPNQSEVQAAHPWIKEHYW